MREHTALPWHESEYSGTWVIDDAHGSHLANVSKAHYDINPLPDEANAAFIARAVNAHEKLVAMLGQLEFVFFPDRDYGFALTGEEECPICLRKPHEANCELAALLTEARDAGTGQDETYDDEGERRTT
jgi:hypothetical protein